MSRRVPSAADRRGWIAGIGGLVVSARVRAQPVEPARPLDLGPLLRRLDGPDASVIVPAGLYAIDNPLVVEGRSGTLAFEDGTVLVPRSAGEGGIRFAACDGLVVRGVRLRWAGAPRTRSHDGAGLLFTGCNDLEASDCEVLGAPGAGIHFELCTRVRARELIAGTTAADGIHFANCSEVSAHRLAVRATGDDGVACVDYATGPASRDIELSEIDVRDSRTRGIAIVGPRGVRIDGFSVESTGSSGVLVVRDDTYRTRRPSQVVIARGRVGAAGRRPPRVGNDFGIEVIEADHVVVRDVRVHDSAGFGVSVVRSHGTVLLERLDVSAAGTGRPAVELRHCEHAVVRDLRIETTDAPGLLVEACERLRAEGLRFRAPPGRPLRWAARFVGPSDIDVGAAAESGGMVRMQIEPGVTGRVRRREGEPLEIDNRGSVRIEPVR